MINSNFGQAFARHQSMMYSCNSSKAIAKHQLLMCTAATLSKPSRDINRCTALYTVATPVKPSRNTNRSCLVAPVATARRQLMMHCSNSGQAKLLQASRDTSRRCTTVVHWSNSSQAINRRCTPSRTSIDHVLLLPSSHRETPIDDALIR
jgi:predicted short-subunit dehydrogenase-like oxidoreductase (DUF2520 family)